jgi:hypothetical protein
VLVSVRFKGHALKFYSHSSLSFMRNFMNEFRRGSDIFSFMKVVKHNQKLICDVDFTPVVDNPRSYLEHKKLSFPPPSEECFSLEL